MKSDNLKKHHFWILAGAAPLLTLLAALFVFSDGGGAVTAAQTDIKSKLDTVSKTNPEGVKAIADWEDQKTKLTKQREKLWQFNWDRQKELFKWPGPQPLLSAMEEKFQQFGDPKLVANNNEFVIFTNKELYEGAYSQAAARIAPTGFSGKSWTNVLRYVSDWGEKVPKAVQIWLALEDLWVQRALLLPIKDVNDGAATFRLVKAPNAPEPPALKRTFESRLWSLELEIPTEGPEANKFIKAKLKNRTDRYQLLGRGNEIRLKIVLSEGAQPIDYRIQGEFVKSGAEIVVDSKVLSPKNHGIPAGTEVKKIVSVTQVLDELTVPVRRIDDITLGYLDARHAPATLKPPTFYPTDAPAAAAGGGPSGPAGPQGSPDGTSVSGPGGRPAGPGSGGGAATVGAKRGFPEQVLDGNKNRYLDTTAQVRRMPVALHVIVDQMFVQDVLVAYSNSPLRMQITQYHWKRFRGNLGGLNDSGTGGGGSGTGSDDYTLPGGSGFGGSGFGASGFGPGPSGPPPRGPGGVGTPPMGPSGPPPGSGFGPGPSGFGPSGFGGSGFGTGSGSGASSSTISEGQLTSGLVELTLYGIVTLYERYDDKKAKEESTMTGTTPMGISPMGTTPMPMGTTPMGTTPMPMGTTPMPMGTTPMPMGTNPMGTSPMGTAPKGPNDTTPKEPGKDPKDSKVDPKESTEPKK